MAVDDEEKEKTRRKVKMVMLLVSLPFWRPVRDIDLLRGLRSDD